MYTQSKCFLCDQKMILFGCEFFAWNVHLKKYSLIMILVVIPVTFGHPWLRHSSHFERVVVLTRSDLNRRCVGIRISRVYPQVISPDIYSFIRREKTQNPSFDILNLGSRKF